MTEHQLQEQLLKAAIAAPLSVWERLNTVLDEDANDASIEHKLTAAALPPPTDAWLHIEKELNWQQQDETIAASLNEQEIQAPAFIWQNVEASLYETNEKALADTLANAELDAPAAAWTNIEEALHPQAKVVPINKGFGNFFRYAAAAAIVGLIAWGAFQLMKQPAELVATADTKPGVETPVITNDKGTKPQPQVRDSESTTIETSLNENLIAYQSPKKQSFRKKMSDEVMAHDKPVASSAEFSETNYLLVLDDKGDLIRISKKLSTMDCIKNSDMPVDAVAALQVKDCENKIKKLQQMMATSVLGSVLDPNALNTVTEK
jgi:hypothetical protein